MRVGYKNKWKIVQDPTDYGYPLCTITKDGNRKHFTPGDNAAKLTSKSYKPGQILTIEQVNALLGRS